jgi:hypothetical protein
MNLLAKLLMPLLSLTMLAGCAAPLLGALGSSSASTTAEAGSAALNFNAAPPSTFDEVEPSTRIGLMSPAALLNENGQLDLAIVDEQCRFHTPDPPFLVPADGAQKAWTFAGRLDHRDKDQFREMESLEYRSLFGLGWSKQQLNTWPVGMTTLSEMPDNYLEQRLAAVANAKVDPSAQSTLTWQYVEDEQRLRQIVARLERTYNPETECASK